MPYIKENYRKQFEEGIQELKTKIDLIHDIDKASKDGLLNFIITKLLLEVYPEENYHIYNEIIGMLECCKLEFYRKMAAPYEAVKERENGKIWEESRYQIGIQQSVEKKEQKKMPKDHSERSLRKITPQPYSSCGNAPKIKTECEKTYSSCGQFGGYMSCS